MANRDTILVDDIDLSTKGVTILEYSGISFAALKDGGFKNPEGIDGVLDSPSTAFSGLTASITVLIEGESEKDVNATYREFKQFIRSRSFWKISTKEDPEFFRYGKFLGESEPGVLTDVPIFAQAHLITKIGIQFKDGYEYSKNVITGQYNYASGINGHEITNPGRPTRHFEVEISTTQRLPGYIRIECIGQGSVEFGTNSIILDPGNRIKFNFGTFELLQLAINNNVKNIFGYLKNAQFFKIPSGKSVLRISYRTSDTATWTTNLPFQVRYSLSPSYY